MIFLTCNAGFRPQTRIFVVGQTDVVENWFRSSLRDATMITCRHKKPGLHNPPKTRHLFVNPEEFGFEVWGFLFNGNSLKDYSRTSVHRRLWGGSEPKPEICFVSFRLFMRACVRFGCLVEVDLNNYPPLFPFLLGCAGPSFSCACWQGAALLYLVKPT